MRRHADHSVGDPQRRQHEGPGAGHARGRHQPRPARDRARDPAGQRRLQFRHRGVLRRRANYTVITGTGRLDHRHATTSAGDAGTDGTDRLRQHRAAAVRRPGRRSWSTGSTPDPVGQLAIRDAATNALDNTPTEGQVLRASIAGVTDADNVSAANPNGTITGPVTYVWQFEDGARHRHLPRHRGRRRRQARDDPDGTTFTVTADLVGLALRVRAVYQDAHGVLENVFSAATAAGGGRRGRAGARRSPTCRRQHGRQRRACTCIRSDLQFILDQILIAERACRRRGPARHPAQLARGLRPAHGRRLVQQPGAGPDRVRRRRQRVPAPDRPGVPRRRRTAPPSRRPNGPWPTREPRTISNLIADQTAGNPAALVASLRRATDGILGTAGRRRQAGVDHQPGPGRHLRHRRRRHGRLLHPERGAGRRPVGAVQRLDRRSSASSSTTAWTWSTRAATARSSSRCSRTTRCSCRAATTNFMVLDARHQPAGRRTASSAPPTTCTSTPTRPRRSSTRTRPTPRTRRTRCSCASTSSNAAGDPVATGRLLANRNLGADGRFGTADDVDLGGMATWAVVKAQARDMLGIQLTDADVLNVPLLATDAYGNFIPGGERLCRSWWSAPAPTAWSARPTTFSWRATRGQRRPRRQHRDRAAHRPRVPGRHRAHRQPFGDLDRNPLTPETPLTADADAVIGDDGNPGHLRQRAARRATSSRATAASTRTSA